MKRILSLTTLLSLVLALSPGSVSFAASVVNTKHDLSYRLSGTVPYQAATGDPALGGTTQVCVFCHSPHGGNTDAPLWNRNSTQSGYTVYASDVLSLMGLTAENPSSGAVHVKTRVCLTCHDGTVALGTLANLPSGIPLSVFSEVQMKDGVNKIQSTAAGYIGLDLSDDHPVAILHDNTKDPELVAPTTGKVRLYGVSGGMVRPTNQNSNFVECTSCHDVHDNRYGKFLIDDQLSAKICTSCHSKRVDAGTSAHDNATLTSYNPDGLGTLGTNVAQVKCLNCHYMHKAGVDPSAPTTPGAGAGVYLNSFKQENSCFNIDSGGKNRYGNSTSVNVCHATGTAVANSAVQTDVGKTSAHRVGTLGGYAPSLHGAAEVRSGVSAGWAVGKWHVECADCHNPHAAGTGLHSVGTNTIGATSALYGSGYVSATYGGSAWSVPTSYGPVEPLGVTNSSAVTLPRYEYEICYKCHSSFATNGVDSSFPNAASFAVRMTDQSREFNPNNAAHPVVSVNSSTLAAYYAAGSPWTNGSQTMYCSDCHSKESSLRPEGPHGSNNSYLLIKPFTDTYSNTLAASQSSGDLCMDCHDNNVYNGGTPGTTGFSTAYGGTNLHVRHKALQTTNGTYAYRCVNCHVKIPHGYPRRGMVVVSTDAGANGDASIYAEGGVSGAKITSFTQPAPFSYGTTTATSNCSTVAGCHHP